MPGHTGSVATRWLGVVVLVGAVALLAFGLLFSDPDVVQGDAVRLMYVHVPSAICMYLGVGALGLGSAVWLKRRTEFWDLLALAGAEIGALFTALTLRDRDALGATRPGACSGCGTPASPSTALLQVMLIGYLALRKLPGDATVRARRAAITGLVIVLDLPLIHYSVEWWRTLHQGATISRLDPQIDGLMLFSLMLGMVVGAARVRVADDPPVPARPPRGAGRGPRSRCGPRRPPGRGRSPAADRRHPAGRRPRHDPGRLCRRRATWRSSDRSPATPGGCCAGAGG